MKTTMLRGFIVGLMAALSAASVLAQAPVPLAGELQVNTYTPNAQLRPAVGLDAGGNFVIAWQSYGSDTTDSSSVTIQAQRYAAGGTPLGAQIQVAGVTSITQRWPSIGLDADGDIVVVWDSFNMPGTDTDQESIRGQRLAADGTFLGGEIQVNSYATGQQLRPTVAADPDGDFVVVWYSAGSSGSDTSGTSIQGQRYAADGTPRGTEFQINSYTPNDQRFPSVSVDGDGDFVVVWESAGSAGTDSSDFSIQGQRFAADGTPLGGQFQVNSYTIGGQRLPEVSLDADGDFVATWFSAGSASTDTDSSSIQARRFAADATPQGDDFQVNTYTTGFQQSASVATDAAGNFVIAWDSFGSAGTDTSTMSSQARAFAADGTPLGGQFQVNTWTLSYQALTAVAGDPAGDFVVTWQSSFSAGTDSHAESIQAQRFGPTLIFTDGFESGDVSAWSALVP